jgi:hypothetical protein
MIGKYACTSAAAHRTRFPIHLFLLTRISSTEAGGLKLKVDSLISEEDLGLDSDR